MLYEVITTHDEGEHKSAPEPSHVVAQRNQKGDDNGKKRPVAQDQMLGKLVGDISRRSKKHNIWQQYQSIDDGGEHHLRLVVILV